MDLSELANLLPRSIQAGAIPLLLGIGVGVLLMFFVRRSTRPVVGITDVGTKSPPSLDHQEGRIAELKDQIVELSAVCERVTTENLNIRQRLKREKKIRDQAESVARRYSEQLDTIAKSDGKLWLNSPNGDSVPFLPLTQRRTAIISTANLKGGVGKTTITANLGATLARMGLRVLMLDLDYQNSLSSLCLTPQEGDQVRRTSRYLNALLENGGDLAALNLCVTPLSADVGDGQLYLAPVNETLGDIENQLMTRWCSGLSQDDVRHRLRRALHSRELRDHYDVVLIDCPPRLTTGCVNALAASDYVLIPVLLEQTSIDAIPRILKWLRKFQAEVCRELDVLGVVGNKANPRTKLIARAQVLWNGLKDDCRSAWGDDVRLFDEIIREHANVQGRFAALDPVHECRYHALADQIREEIPNARLQPSAVPPLASASA
ncbi:MAG: ParA family protein [Isosphaeraceae bacterium]